MNSVEQEKETKKQQARRTRGIFIVLLVIVALLMFILGGSFAYFIATTSSAPSAVQSGSASFALDYFSYDNMLNTDLIPAERNVVLYAAIQQDDSTITNPENGANGLCQDDFGKSVCSIYNFRIVNPSDSSVTQNINIKLKSETNQFGNLKITVIKPDLLNEDKSNTDEAILEEVDLTQNQTEYILEGLKTSLAPGESVSYQMIIWIQNLDGDQTELDANKSYAGTIYVYPDEDGDAGQIKGVISAVSE